MTKALFIAALGVAVAGIVLIYRGHRRNRDEINRLRAEVTAAKIAALQQAAATPPPTEELPPPQEPARRKRHLALYVGGLAALIAWLGDRVRNTWKNHRTATTAAALVATAATAAAATHQVTSSGTDDHTGPQPPTTISTQQAEPGHDGAPSAGQPSAEETVDPALIPTDSFIDLSPDALHTTPRAEETGHRTAPSQREPADHSASPRPDGTPSRDTSGREDNGQSPTTPPPTQPDPPQQPPPPTQQPPTQEPPTTPPPTDDPPDEDCTIHVGLPPLLEICL